MGNSSSTGLDTSKHLFAADVCKAHMADLDAVLSSKEGRTIVAQQEKAQHLNWTQSSSTESSGSKHTKSSRRGSLGSPRTSVPTVEAFLRLFDVDGSGDLDPWEVAMLLDAVGVIHNDRDVMNLFLDSSLSRPSTVSEKESNSRGASSSQASIVDTGIGPVVHTSTGGTPVFHMRHGAPQISLRALQEVLMTPVDKTKGSPRSRIRTRSSSLDLTGCPAPLASTENAWTRSDFEQQLAYSFQKAFKVLSHDRRKLGMVCARQALARAVIVRHKESAERDFVRAHTFDAEKALAEFASSSDRQRNARFVRQADNLCVLTFFYV